MSGEAGPLGLERGLRLELKGGRPLVEEPLMHELEIHDLRKPAKGQTGPNLPEKSTQDGGEKQASWRRQLTVVDRTSTGGQLSRSGITNE